MIKGDYLVFLNDISCKKPNDFFGKNSECPFCRREKLENIICEDGSYIFLENKYKTLKDTDQFLIIETYTCEKQMHEYSEEYMKKLIRFSMDKFKDLENSNKYKSVIFYKNYGKDSVGSLKHPHMQIIGLKTIDYKQNVQKDNFEGVSIYENDAVIVTLSDKPINAFTEFNIIINDNLKYIDDFSCCILKTVKYIKYDYFADCRSFNLFFYHYENKIICKVCPRFVTSPLILGYGIKQISDKLDEIAEKLKLKYFN